MREMKRNPQFKRLFLSFFFWGGRLARKDERRGRGRLCEKKVEKSGERKLMSLE
jgi:hypothetical protein